MKWFPYYFAYSIPITLSLFHVSNIIVNLSETTESIEIKFHMMTPLDRVAKVSCRPNQVCSNDDPWFMIEIFQDIKADFCILGLAPAKSLLPADLKV